MLLHLSLKIGPNGSPSSRTLGPEERILAPGPQAYGPLVVQCLPIGTGKSQAMSLQALQLQTAVLLFILLTLSHLCCEEDQPLRSVAQLK